MLDDVPQMQVHGSVLSTREAGEADRDVGWLRCSQCVLNLGHFQLLMGLLGCNPIIS